MLKGRSIWIIHYIDTRVVLRVLRCKRPKLDMTVEDSDDVSLTKDINGNSVGPLMK